VCSHGVLTLCVTTVRMYSSRCFIKLFYFNPIIKIILRHDRQNRTKWPFERPEMWKDRSNTLEGMRHEN